MGIFSTFIISFLLVFKYNKNIDEKTKLEIYSGVINKIKYDEKAYPYIYIGDTNYYIGSGFKNIDEIVKVGDSIVKKHGKLHYILYRKNGKGEWQLIYNEPG